MMRPPTRCRPLRIRTLRQALHLSQSALATVVGCDRSFISQIELHLAMPSLPMATRLARALQVPHVDDLYEDTPCPTCGHRTAAHAPCESPVS